jgi:hypothetical protein
VKNPINRSSASATNAATTPMPTATAEIGSSLVVVVKSPIFFARYEGITSSGTTETVLSRLLTPGGRVRDVQPIKPDRLI